ncbi:MAG: DUF3990 domain-containing protein [Fibrobacter sp.]|nr:DUF3990 domain-containing protein [Fibrobacter sp.]
MIVYHGSNQVVQNPDVRHSNRALDFGKGFYVTTVKEQAVRWAKRKKLLFHGTAILNVFEMNAISTDLKFKDFGEDLPGWIKFVCDCRDGGADYLQYDIIKGKVADDKVFRVVDMFHSGVWDINRAIEEIKAYPTFDQICFVTQDAIAKILSFMNYEEV